MRADYSGPFQPVASVRLSRAEYTLLASKAATVGLKVNAYVRAILRDFMGWVHDDTR